MAQDKLLPKQSHPLRKKEIASLKSVRNDMNKSVSVNQKVVNRIYEMRPLPMADLHHEESKLSANRPRSSITCRTSIGLDALSYK